MILMGNLICSPGFEVTSFGTHFPCVKATLNSGRGSVSTAFPSHQGAEAHAEHMVVASSKGVSKEEVGL